MAGSLIGLNPNTSDSVTLSKLLDGTYDGITVGDKDIRRICLSTIGDMPDAEDVMVLGFRDYEWQLRFHISRYFY